MNEAQMIGHLTGSPAVVGEQVLAALDTRAKLREIKAETDRIQVVCRQNLMDLAEEYRIQQEKVTSNRDKALSQQIRFESEVQLACNHCFKDYLCVICGAEYNEP